MAVYLALFLSIFLVILVSRRDIIKKHQTQGLSSVLSFDFNLTHFPELLSGSVVGEARDRDSICGGE